MLDNRNHIDISERVMNEIGRRGLKMRPRIYFTALRWGRRAGLAIGALAAIFFVNLAIFKFRFYDPFGFLRLGDFHIFWDALPWPAIIGTLISVAFAIIFFRNFDRISGSLYEKRFMPAFGFLLVILIGGSLLDSSGVNERLRKSPNRIWLYEGHFLTDYGAMGKVISADNAKKRLEIITPNNERVFVEWDQKTRLPLGGNFKIGSVIQAIGEWNNDTLIARGITISNTSF